MHDLARGARDDPGRTYEILARPGFLRSMAEFEADNPPVSAVSCFSSDVWTLELPPGGDAKQCRLDFRDLDDALASELKVAILVSALEPTSRRYRMAAMAQLGRNLITIGSWMTRVEITTIAHLRPGIGRVFLQAMAEFVCELHAGTLEESDWDPRPRNVVGQRSGLLGRQGNLSDNAVAGLASAFILLHEAGDTIERLTGARIRGAPFESDVAADVAKGYRSFAGQATERIPDAILRPLLVGARRMLGTPKDDVCRVLREFAARCDAGMTPFEAGHAVAQFEFGEIEPGEGPWQVSSRPKVTGAIWIRIVMNQVVCAAIMIILLETGMRPSECLTLMGGRRRRRAVAAALRRDLPRCVSETLSKSGFSASLLLHGHVFKQRGEVVPRPVSWLLGGRQPGEDDPWVVKALQALEDIAEILRPYAEEEFRGLLIFSLGTDIYAPLASVRVTSSLLAGTMSSAIARFADISSVADTTELGRPLRAYKESEGRCIALYQFRKTYAQSRYAILPRLLLAISAQLQHVSPDDTMRSYVTQDPAFRRELEDHRSRRNAFEIRRIMDGVTVTEGSMLETLARVRPLVARGMSAEERAKRWAACLDDVGGLFQAGRLRPVSGAANLLASLSGEARSKPADPSATGSDGPVAFLEFIGGREAWLDAVEAGDPDPQRASRDLALHAERALGALGFEPEGASEEDAGWSEEA
jgi:hypothetical protein